jgi:hypothetical protein
MLIGKQIGLIYLGAPRYPGGLRPSLLDWLDCPKLLDNTLGHRSIPLEERKTSPRR